MTGFETIKQYTPDEAAQIVGVTRRTFYAYMKDKKIRSHKIGGRWMITHDDLAAFLTGRTGEPQQETATPAE